MKHFAVDIDWTEDMLPTTIGFITIGNSMGCRVCLVKTTTVRRTGKLTYVWSFNEELIHWYGYSRAEDVKFYVHGRRYDPYEVLLDNNVGNEFDNNNFGGVPEFVQDMKAFDITPDKFPELQSLFNEANGV